MYSKLSLALIIMVMSLTGAFTSSANGMASAPTNLTAALDSLVDNPPVKPALQFTAVAGASHYRLHLRNATTNKVVADRWFTTAEAFCNNDENCVLGWTPLIIALNNANSEVINSTTDAVYPDWGLVNGEYHWWVGAYVPEAQQTFWSGGNDLEPATFTVDVPTPKPVGVSGYWDNYYPYVGVDYHDNTLWLRLIVSGNGEYYSKWYNIEDEECFGTCHFSNENYLPLYWGPGEYNVYAQAWGPGGFSSPDGSNSAESWSSNNYAEGLVFPSEAPIADTISVQTVDSKDIRVTWSLWENGMWYQLIIMGSGNNEVYKQWHHGADIDCGSSCEILVPDVPDGEYTIYLRGWGPAGMSVGGPQNNGYAIQEFGHNVAMAE